jgi:hypothetical protein
MVILVEKLLCKHRKYKKVVSGTILIYSSILKYWIQVTSTIFFLWIDVFKYKVSNDLDENWLNYGTFVSGGHLEFLRHFEVLFLKIHIFFFLWSRLPKYVIRSTRKLRAHGTVFFSYNCSPIKMRECGVFCFCFYIFYIVIPSAWGLTIFGLVKKLL